MWSAISSWFKKRPKTSAALAAVVGAAVSAWAPVWGPIVLNLLGLALGGQ